MRRGFFDEQNGTHNLTILVNTDSVPIFKSSGFSLWPILFQIVKLPFHLRYILYMQARRQNFVGGTFPDVSIHIMYVFV